MGTPRPQKRPSRTAAVCAGYLFSAFSNSTTLNTYSAHVLKQLADMVACEAQANATACGADPACELLPCGACGIGAAAPSLLLDSEHEAGTCNGSLAARTKVCAQVRAIKAGPGRRNFPHAASSAAAGAAHCNRHANTLTGGPASPTTREGKHERRVRRGGGLLPVGSPDGVVPGHGNDAGDA